MASFRANISGRVQGVGFRYFVQRKAVSYGLRGYTWNMPNGNVEVVAEGAREKLIAFASELKKGPALSIVNDIQVIWSDTEQNFKDFNIRF